MSIEKSFLWKRLQVYFDPDSSSSYGAAFWIDDNELLTRDK